ncbi:MAG: site-specific integrase [Deltaproteobacteria bacterium]|nr:site-specific integrase [Deltaproteobacteria bacterium]
MGSKKGAIVRFNILEDYEIDALLRSCISFEEELVIRGLLYTGMRISEFIHMNNDWIDWRSEIIYIPEKQKCNCYECRGMWRVKTKDAVRPIPILPEVRHIFITYFNKHYAIMETIPNRVYAWRIVKTVAKRANVKHRVFPHVLRATFATILGEKGFSENKILRVLGWKKRSSTVDVYVRPRPEAIKREFEEKW